MRQLLTPLFLLAGLAVSFVGPSPAALAEQVIEHDDAGRVTAKYSTDDEGRRHGNYAEFHENGAIKLKSIYRRGRLHGRYVSYHASGRPHVTAEYKNGEPEGKYVEKDDVFHISCQNTALNCRSHCNDFIRVNLSGGFFSKYFSYRFRNDRRTRLATYKYYLVDVFGFQFGVPKGFLTRFNR